MRTLLLAGFCLAATAEPAAARPAAGRTSQRAGTRGAQKLPSNAVSFRLAGGALRRFSIPFAAACKDGKRPVPELLDRVLIVDPLRLRRGRFTAAGHYEFPPGRAQDATVDFTLRGAVGARRASGTLEVDGSISADDLRAADCSSRIQWRATLGRRARSLAAPARERPRPLFTGQIVFARAPATGGPSAIFTALPHEGLGEERITRPPAGASDTAPAVTGSQDPSFVFARASGGSSQLYLTDLEGLGGFETPFPDGRISNFPQGAHDPALSRGGNVALSVGQAADCSIWVMGKEGEKPHQVTDHGGAPGCDSEPAWAPDGKRIAFRRTVTDAGGAALGTSFFTVAVGGGAPAPLDLGPVAPSGFAWSPGPAVAYVVAGATGAPATLAIINADGSGPRTVLSAAGLGGRPAWSPNGDQLAVTVQRADGSTDLLAVPVAGGQPADVTATAGVSEQSPAWNYPPPTAGGGEPGPSVHVHSQSARGHRKRKHT